MMAASHDAPTTYLVGRSAEADIVIGDPTVSRKHAELVHGTDGTWYLTDRGSTGGTHVLDGDDWVPVKQEFVRPGDWLKFGGFECTLDDLLRRIPTASPAQAAGPAPSGGGTTIGDDRPRGAVARDPNTGEIIRKETD